jgi:2-(1,2-epoxy-1,2-dihydrophenyl)acetyl-CoA isomerase
MGVTESIAGSRGAVLEHGVTTAVADGVGTITLNRPERLNAFDVEMLQDLAGAVRAFVADESVRAIVLTGAGRGFCAGADLGRLDGPAGAVDEDYAMALVRAGSEVVQLLHRAPKPVLASLNGPAAGGGVGLALACDLRIAAESASLGLVFHRLGLHPDLGTSWFVSRLAGSAAALELFWTPRMLAASRCMELGLVNRVVPDERLAYDTAQWAARLAALPPIAARLAKRAVREAESTTLAESLVIEARHCQECFRSADAAEGLEAYRANRIPEFHGR